MQTELFVRRIVKMF